MKSVELTRDQIIGWMVSDFKPGFHEPLPMYAMRQEFPEVEVARDENEDDNWRKFMGLDALDDAIVTRYLSIDLSRGGGTLFYERSGHWCFEHRRYMTEVESGKFGQGDQRSHYELHGFNEDSYYRAADSRGKEVLTYGSAEGSQLRHT